MYDVRIPDNLYQRASQAALAQHVSVDEFVAEAVQLHLQDEAHSLSPEQMVIIRRSQAEIKAGKGLTMEQVEVRLAAKKAEWLAANHT